MNKTRIPERTTKNVTTFFVLTFVLTIPSYIMTIFVPELEAVASLLFTFVPIISALILTIREHVSTRHGGVFIPAVFHFDFGRRGCLDGICF